jgi:uncharacterized membrane protein
LGNFFNYWSLLLFLAYLAPLGFLPLKSIKWAIPGLFILGMSLASRWGGQHNMINQYPAGAIPFLFIAAIITLSKGFKMRENLVMLCLVASMIVIISPLSRTILASFPNVRTEALDKVIREIPDGSSVTANNVVFPHLIARTNAYLPKFYTEGISINTETSEIGFPNRDTEYVVITDVLYQNNWEKDIQTELNFKYSIVADIGGTQLYKLKGLTK